VTRAASQRQIEGERWRLLVHLIRMLDPLMAALGIFWLLLTVIDLTGHLSPALVLANRVIWIVFVVDFAAEFLVAPRKGRYLRRHWLMAIALVLPALRVVRLIRFARVLRSLRGVNLVRTLTSANRAMFSLRATMRRRGFAYIMALTMLVTFAGAAGMYALEKDVPDPNGIHNFATALWWTAMIMTTMGSAYWPQTAEGRLLCVGLALYAFAMFGYITATVASFFVARDAERDNAPVAGRASVEALGRQI
jgi:voltage-gated potassium channel